MIRKPIFLSAHLNQNSCWLLLLIILVFTICFSLTNSTRAGQYIGTSVLDSDGDGLEDSLEAKLKTGPKAVDSDGDGLSDYEEYCKYYTDPTKKDSDNDGKPDGDWDERREYAYTIRALCEIRPPSNVEMINDLYQDVRPVSKKASLEDAKVVEVLLFPFSSPHIYAQPYPREFYSDLLQQYIQPTVSMNFSPEMKNEICKIVNDASTDIEAIEKILQWINNETNLVRYNPHWEFFHVVDEKIVWHKSLGGPEENKLFLEMNFFGDSMFKNKVHGTCSSLAILRGTMLRAAGLPTRLIQTLPLITRYTGDAEPLAERLRMRAMAKGYDWGPGNGGANHTYNEVYLNNQWVRVDNSINVGPFVDDKLFVKAWSYPSWNNLKEEWNEKRCLKALDVSDAYPKYESEFMKVDIAIEDKDLTVTLQPDGRFRAQVEIRNRGNKASPSFSVYFYAGDPDEGARLLARHSAGPILPGGYWGEYNPRLELMPEEDTIAVLIDPDNKVDESDETNNKASKRVPAGRPMGEKSQYGKPSESLPNIFIMCPSGFNMFREIFEMVRDVTYNKTGRYHEIKSYDEIFIDGIHNKKSGDIIVLLFSLDTDDRIPGGYEDLLTLGWSGIESALKQGKTLEFRSNARDMNVILLAAPTIEQLGQLVKESKLLKAL